MTDLYKELQDRSNNKCELCGSNQILQVYEVGDSPVDVREKYIIACTTCVDQLVDLETVNPNHWRGLNDAMWNENPAVQVIVYRMLHHLKPYGWSVDLLEIMYMEESTLKWAQAGLADENAPIHRDSNGHVLKKGDNVVLIKDLDVKGAGFTAKRGTAVRNINLSPDNENHIEGKINGQHIVILTQYLKKL
ncbi:MAG: PhnA domain-containing protein [Nonlabens sp.]